MKNKMKFLIKQSILKKINTKWFKAVNVLLAILIIFLCNIDKVIGFFGGDFNETKTIKIVDQANAYNLFENYYQELEKQTGNIVKYDIEKTDKSISDLKKDVEENKKNIIIHLQSDDKEIIKADIISYDPVETINYQLISSALNSLKSEYALANSNLSEIEIKNITTPMSIKQINTNPEIDENNSGKEMVANIVLIAFIIPFFILVIILVQMLGAEINDEKSSRSMEIIISNVSPKTHFMSKILGATSFVLIQCGLFIAYAGLGILIRYLLNGGLGIESSSAISGSISQIFEMFKTTGILSTLAGAIPLIILLLIINLFAFALLAGILASMTTSIEDYQQLQTPLMIICLVSYYVAFMATYFDGAIFIKIVSFLPFFSSMIAPVLYILGQTTIYELLISVFVTGLTCFLLFKYGLRIYKVGILNYSSKDLWKKIFKSIKEK